MLYPQPPWQDRHVRDEANITHQRVAFRVGVVAQHSELAPVARESENGLQSRRFASAVRTDQSYDFARFDRKARRVKCAHAAVGFTERVRLDDFTHCSGFLVSMAKARSARLRRFAGARSARVPAAAWSR